MAISSKRLFKNMSWIFSSKCIETFYYNVLWWISNSRIVLLKLSHVVISTIKFKIMGVWFTYCILMFPFFQFFHVANAARYWKASIEAATECFIKNGLLKNFAKFTGKNLCRSLLKGCRPQTCKFIKKSPRLCCFLVNFAKFLRKRFLRDTSRRLLLQQNKWEHWYKLT